MKNGFTLIEVLITMVIFSLFLILTYPIYNNVVKSLNDINIDQINTLETLRLHQKINQITIYENDIYYQKEDELINIIISNNKISFNSNNEILINDINYEAVLVDYDIKENFIILNCQLKDDLSIYVLRGNVYEVSTS